MRRKRPAAICTLKPFEWDALAKLLRQGYAFSDAYTLIQGDGKLLRALEQGESLSELLLQGHHGSFYDHLRFFMSITSLSEAISAALQMDETMKSMRRRLVKQCRYPMLLFVMAFFTLTLFTTRILPQLMQSFTMNEENELLLKTVVGLRGLAVVVLWLIIMGLLIALIANRSSKGKLRILQALRFSCLPQQYCSYLLAGYFAQLHRHGVTTKNAFAFLTRFKDGSLLAHCAVQIEAQLQAGVPLTECLSSQPWLDHAFVRTWRIAEHTHSLEASLEQYQRRQEALWEQLLKRVGMGIQIGVYLFIALMVLIVYQIMLVPLQLMESM